MYSYLSDSHVHTRFSSDSSASVRKTIEAAHSLGMEQITITDHQDFCAEDGLFKLNSNIDEYFDTLTEYRDIYSANISIGIGCEIGFEADNADRINAFAASKPFDLIIGSLHFIDGTDIYYPEFYAGRTRDEVLRTYFRSAADAMKACGNFDIYGHPDYILRYCPGKNRNFDIREYFDLTDEIFTYIIKNDKGIEINTAGYSAGLNAPNPSYELLLRYRELGGKIITFASDAHTPENVGAYFEKASALARRAGFNEYYTYRKRTPIPHGLERVY